MRAACGEFLNGPTCVSRLSDAVFCQGSEIPSRELIRKILGRDPNPSALICDINRASPTKELDVDWLGALGMCSLPGHEGRKVADDVASLKRQGCSILVSLVEEHEFSEWATGDLHALVELCRAAAIEHIHFPFKDMSVPPKGPAFDELVAKLSSAVLADRKVVIHCRMGKGRTGLLFGCLLVQLDRAKSGAEAVKLTRRVRRGTIQTSQQEFFVERYKKK